MAGAAQERRPRQEREQLVLDTAARLFYARGVRSVGMDELVRESGLGKATVYRLYPTKDALVHAYLARLSARILELVDADLTGPDPAAALDAVLAAVEQDISRPDFRGCPFHNASIEYDDPASAVRGDARDHRTGLRDRLVAAAARLGDPSLGDRLAVLVDGAYTSAAHLGPDGPARAGLRLARQLVDEAR